MKRFTIFAFSFLLLGLAILSLPIEDRTLAEDPEDQVTAVLLQSQTTPEGVNLVSVTSNFVSYAVFADVGAAFVDDVGVVVGKDVDSVNKPYWRSVGIHIFNTNDLRLKQPYDYKPNRRARDGLSAELGNSSNNFQVEPIV